MPRGPKGEKRPAGLVECAHEVFRIATGEKEDQLPSGRHRSGTAGARARTQSLSATERKQIAKKAAHARWDGKNDNARGEPMAEKERLFSALFPAGEGGELANVKFFVLDHSITEEELCREFADAIEEHRSEQALKIEDIDAYLHSKGR